MAEPQGFRRDGPASAGPLPVEEVAERAARLGIIVERIVEELRAIAFADITRIISWDAEKLTLTASDKLDKADKPAIAEIIASAKDKKIYRVKLHDKTPAFALLTRILEKFAKPDEQAENDSEEARQFLFRELERLAAETADEEETESDREAAAGNPVAA